MAQIETTYSATETEAFFDDESGSNASGGYNPDQSEAGMQYHITLIFDDHDSGNFDISRIYDFLNSEYATVACDKIPTRNEAILRITGGLA